MGIDAEGDLGAVGRVVRRRARGGRTRADAFIRQHAHVWLIYTDSTCWEPCSRPATVGRLRSSLERLGSRVRIRQSHRPKGGRTSSRRTGVLALRHRPAESYDPAGSVRENAAHVHRHPARFRPVAPPSTTRCFLGGGEDVDAVGRNARQHGPAAPVHPRRAADRAADRRGDGAGGRATLGHPQRCKEKSPRTWPTTKATPRHRPPGLPGGHEQQPRLVDGGGEASRDRRAAAAEFIPA